MQIVGQSWPSLPAKSRNSWCGIASPRSARAQRVRQCERERRRRVLRLGIGAHATPMWMRKTQQTPPFIGKKVAQF